MGPARSPGDDKRILATCDLLIATGENMLAWEEEVRFANLPDKFTEMLDALRGFGGNQIEELLRIPKEISSAFSVEKPVGMHKINLVLRPPDDLQENLRKAMEPVTRG